MWAEQLVQRKRQYLPWATACSWRGSLHVQAVLPPPLSARPTVVLEGASKAGLTTAGHGGSTTWTIPCFDSSEGSGGAGLAPSLPQPFTGSPVLCTQPRARTVHAVLMRLQGRTLWLSLGAARKCIQPPHGHLGERGPENQKLLPRLRLQTQSWARKA